MSLLSGAYLFAASATPTEPVKIPDDDQVTPGTIGFVFTAIIVVITIFLMRDAMRRVRRIRAYDGAEDVSPIPIDPNYQPSTARHGYGPGKNQSDVRPAAKDAEDATGNTAGNGPEEPGEAPGEESTTTR